MTKGRNKETHTERTDRTHETNALRNHEGNTYTIK